MNDIKPGWAYETMMMINRMTPDIKDKAFEPDWFLLRERLEEAERLMRPAGSPITFCFCPRCGQQMNPSHDASKPAKDAK